MFAMLLGGARAEVPVERIELSTTDTQRGLSSEATFQTSGIDLTAAQSEAMHKNPWIDVKTGPLARVRCKLIAQGSAAEELAYKASIMIPYQASEGVRPAELEAFIWNDQEHSWHSLGGTMREDANGFYQIVSETTPYPSLNALLVRTVRLGEIVVFRKRADWGMEPGARQDATPAPAGNLVEGVSVTENDALLFVESSSVALTIEKATGAIYEYTVKTPRAVYLYGAGTRRSEDLYRE